MGLKLRFNMRADAGETYPFPGWTDVALSTVYPNTPASGIAAGFVAGAGPSGAFDSDSGLSPDERYDGGVSTSQADAFGALFRMDLPVGLYRFKLVAGKASGISGTEARIQNTGGSPEVWLLGSSGNPVNAAAGEWLDVEDVLWVQAAGDTRLKLKALTAPRDAVVNFFEVEQIDQGGAAGLALAIKAAVAAVPYMGAVYDHKHSFPDQKSTRDAGTVTLADATDRLRLGFVGVQSERTGFSNRTQELIHTVTVTLLQAFAGGVNDAQRISEVELRAVAEQVSAALSDGRIGGDMQISIGDGWLGFRADGLPGIRPVEAVSFNGDTWTKFDIIVRVSEEVST